MSPCCENPENRETVEEREDLTVQRCKECGRRHYEVTLEPVEIGVKIKGF
jgi:hypothetical protein